MKVLYVILSCEKYLTTRRNWQLDTWVGGIPAGSAHLYLSGGNPEGFKDVLLTDCGDTYQEAPRKYLSFFARFEEFSGFDYYYFCDDDTFVFPMRLMDLLERSGEPWAVGRRGLCFDNSPQTSECRYPLEFFGGGAGFALSNDTCQKIARYLEGLPADKIPISANTDVTIGHWIRAVGLDVGSLPNRDDVLKAQHLLHPENRGIAVESTVSFHYVDEGQMRLLGAQKIGRLNWIGRRRVRHWLSPPATFSSPGDSDKLRILHIANSVSSSSASKRLADAVGLSGQVVQDFLTLDNVNGYLTHEAFAPRVARVLNRALKRWLFSRSKPGSIIDVWPVDFPSKPRKDWSRYDVVHFHWTNSELMAPKLIRNLDSLGVKVVVTLHDSFWFTGVCHVRSGCEQYHENGCSQCPLFERISAQRVVRNLFLRRLRAQPLATAVVTAPSAVHAGFAEKSPLLRGKKVHVLPNPIDEKIFRVAPKTEARKKLDIGKYDFVIGFGAVSARSNPYKGFAQLEQALSSVVRTLGTQVSMALVTFGEDFDSVPVGYDLINLGEIRVPGDLADVYSALDLFVNPSWEESFGQTTLEALSCGRPVVAFKTTGASEMVRHKENGYLADWKNSEDLANGILWAYEVNEQLGPSQLSRSVSRFRYSEMSSVLLEFYRGIGPQRLAE